MKKKEKFYKESRYNVSYTALNQKQQQLWDSLHKNTITIAIGSAGTGKTLTAAAFAAKEVGRNNYQKIILCRANVPTGRTLGSFPGTVEEKLTPWLSHIINYLIEYLGKGTIDTWSKGEHPRLILQPLETIRGSSFSDTIVIIDESQQLSWSEIKTLSTRIGNHSKLILTGDPTQRDIKASGVETFIEIVNKYRIPDVGIINFTPNDIVRSDIVKNLILAYEKEGI